ncbi:MAG: hypothetical protein A2Z72_08445 [Omnitrophica bacterium RBG_13_46_9]|nr:MAG: hypothetical protein A2Z72_08445 [Omnitrophica bacterium RBG_13_46_9]
MSKTDETARTYSYLWGKERERGVLPESHHYNKLQEVVPFPIVSGTSGIDAGCGNGYDLRLMALKYPDVNFVGLDISDGIYNAKKNCEGIDNIQFIKGSLLNLPFKDGVFDFAYSFGAIHHTPKPERSFIELGRVLNKGSAFIAYLYEKHEDNPLKRFPLMVVWFLRLFSTKIPKKILYVLCMLLSPLVYLLFSVPAKVLALSERTKRFSGKMPFNFARGPFSLTGDLYDRFGAPIEYRYSRKEVIDLFDNASFKDIQVTKLKDTAGWVGWGKVITS